MKAIRAFSATEVLVALAIVGILCVTMLSLNDMTDRNYKVATTKMLQIDSTLKSWGKAITKSNETGLGALQVVHDQASLEKSLKEYNMAKNLSSKKTNVANNRPNCLKVTKNKQKVKPIKKKFAI